MDEIEQVPDISPEDLATINEARRTEYHLMLIAEGARPDGLLDPQKMEEITRREIEAGRMAPDDGLRQDTVRALAGTLDVENKREAPRIKGTAINPFE